MQLNELLKICLLALASRYPDSVVEINEAVLGQQSYRSEACSPLRLIELLQINAPQVLISPASVVIDAQKSEIYLIEQSEEIPAFWIYCEGFLPSE
jgi:hypothetical protein